MKSKITITTAIMALGVVAANAATLITPTSVTASAVTTEFFPASNLINSSGLPSAPTIGDYATMSQTGTSDVSRAWVTNDPGAGGGDYFLDGPGNPVMTFDLGSALDLTDFVYWGYNNGGTGNEASDFTLTFSTDNVSFGSSVAFDQSGSPMGLGAPATLSLGSTINAQYVRVEMTDNQGGIDRVGLGEVRFIAVPEPSSAALLGLGGLALILRRRK